MSNEIDQVQDEQNSLPAYQTWTMPSMGVSSKPSIIKTNTKEEQERKVSEIRAKAQQEGYEAGIAQGKDEIERQIEELKKIINFFNKPLISIQKTIELQIYEMIKVLVFKIIQINIDENKDCMIGLIETALATLPLMQNQAKIFISQNDAKFQESIQSYLADKSISNVLEIDPKLNAGELKVDIGVSAVEVSLTTLLNPIMDNHLLREKN